MKAEELRQRLSELLRTVPPAYQGWGSERTKEYKAAALKAADYVRKKTTQVHLLEPALKALESFYGNSWSCGSHTSGPAGGSEAA